MYFAHQVNLKRTQEKNKNNSDNNQRLVWVFLGAIEIHATQTEPYLHLVGSWFSTYVHGDQLGKAKT